VAIEMPAHMVDTKVLAVNLAASVSIGIKT